jgi:hypothetical protein
MDSRRGFVRKPQFWTLFVGLAVTTTLIVFGLQAVRIVKFTVVPDSETWVKLPCKYFFAKSHGGAASFDFSAEVVEPTARNVTLWVRLPDEGQYDEQQTWPVDNRGNVRGVVQIGGKRWPLNQNEDYSFRLTAEGDKPLMDGEIKAEVIDVATAAPPSLIVWLGVMASVVQIVQVMVGGLWKRQADS